MTFGTFELGAEGMLNRERGGRADGRCVGPADQCSEGSIDASAATPADSSEARQLTAMKPMFDWYERHSLLGSALTVRAILGYEPRTLRTYLEELAGAA